MLAGSKSSDEEPGVQNLKSVVQQEEENKLLEALHGPNDGSKKSFWKPQILLSVSPGGEAVVACEVYYGAMVPYRPDRPCPNNDWKLCFVRHVL